MAKAWASEEEFEIHKLPDPLHNRIVDWQKRHFTEFDYLVDNWSKHYKQAPFRLIAKLGPTGDLSVVFERPLAHLALGLVPALVIR